MTRGGCEGAPYLNLLPWGDLCVTLGGRFWQGRADPTSPRPHPNPLPAGEGEDLPAPPTPQPAGGLGKGSPAGEGVEPRTASRATGVAPPGSAPPTRLRRVPSFSFPRGGKAGGEGDSLAPTGGEWIEGGDAWAGGSVNPTEAGGTTIAAPSRRRTRSELTMMSAALVLYPRLPSRSRDSASCPPSAQSGIAWSTVVFIALSDNRPRGRYALPRPPAPAW